MSGNGKIIRLSFETCQLVIDHTFGNCDCPNGILRKMYLNIRIPGISVPIVSSTSRQLVHTIVALIFLSRNLDVQIVVHHRNGISWDNRVPSLKWVTERENTLYANGMPFQVIEQGSNKICNYFSMQEDVTRGSLRAIQIV